MKKKIILIIISLIILLTITGVICYIGSNNENTKEEKSISIALKILKDKYSDNNSKITYQDSNKDYYIFIKMNKTDSNPIERYLVNKKDNNDIIISSVTTISGD